MANDLSSVDFRFEPENRTSIGLVSGEQIQIHGDDVSGDAAVHHLINESGEIIGEASKSAMSKLSGKAYVLRVSDDCRTVDVTIVTAGKTVNTALDAGWNAWKGCMCMVLMIPFIFIIFVACSAIF